LLTNENQFYLRGPNEWWKHGFATRSKEERGDN
jgi:hypothetical protein